MLWFGTAISQSTVTNDQLQVGNVFATQQLDVVTADSDTTATTTATGNSFTGSVNTGDVDVQSNQTTLGTTQAQTTVNVDSNAGEFTTMTTAATANTGQSVISGGGTLSGNYTQTSAGPLVDGESQLNAPNAQTGDIAESVQAIANSQGYGATDSNISTSTTQVNSSTVMANGGAILGDVVEQGSFIAIGTGNNVNSDGAGNTSQDLAVNQTNNADVTQGAMFVNLGNSQITNTSATSTGNNMSATNTQGSLNAGVSQDNESYVRAQSVETSFAFGGANVSAYGVGNSVLAANIGPSVGLNNVQVNGTGGVESIASFQGDNGYDAFVASTAVGNAATAFSCSSCGGVMSVRNSQTNNGDAAATASVGLTSGARSVRSTATAAGNTGTFYVTSPN